MSFYNDLVQTRDELQRSLGHRSAVSKPQVIRNLVQTLFSEKYNVAFAAAAAGANVSEVTVTVTDGNGNALETIKNMNVWLSDDSEGAGLTATAASGTVQAKAASGTDLGVVEAKKQYTAQTLDDGTYVMEITDSAKTGFYVCVELMGNIYVSDQLQTADYG